MLGAVADAPTRFSGWWATDAAARRPR
jgi:hypothetical protein